MIYYYLLYNMQYWCATKYFLEALSVPQNKKLGVDVKKGWKPMPYMVIRVFYYSSDVEIWI
jgi:hypothetical protein